MNSTRHHSTTHKVVYNAEYIVACSKRVLFQAGNHHNVRSLRVLVRHRHLHLVVLADV